MSKLFLTNKNFIDLICEKLIPRKKRNWEYKLKKFVFGYYSEIILHRNFWDLYVYNFLKKQKILYDFNFSYNFSHDQSIVYVYREKTQISNTNLMSFSFCIPTKSSSTQLDNCLEHIFAAATKNVIIEVLIATDNYEGKFADKVKVLTINDKLTVKKNLLLNEAKYDNICVLHERILIPSNFFTDICKINPNYEIIGYRILFNGIRIGDWLASYIPFFGVAFLDYKSYTANAYLDGSFIQINKNIKNHVLWDENLEWNQGEDIRLFLDLYEKGIVSEIYPGCVLESSSWDWKKGLYAYFDNNKIVKVNLLKTIMNYLSVKMRLFVKEFHFAKN